MVDRMNPAEIAAQIMARAVASVPVAVVQLDIPSERGSALWRKRMSESVARSWEKRKLNPSARMGRPRGK